MIRSPAMQATVTVAKAIAVIAAAVLFSLLLVVVGNYSIVALVALLAAVFLALLWLTAYWGARDRANR